MDQDTVTILMPAALQYLLITVKLVELEKFSFSDTQNPKLFVNTLTVNEKHCLLNRDNLTQPIQIQLSEKQETFSEFSFAFLKSMLNYKHLPKRDDPRS